MVECGACALWNGSVRGGAPAFVDPHASLLHPLVFIPTLLLGVIAGSKGTLVAAFFCHGAAQMDEGLVGMALSASAGRRAAAARSGPPNSIETPLW